MTKSENFLYVRWMRLKTHDVLINTSFRKIWLLLTALLEDRWKIRKRIILFCIFFPFLWLLFASPCFHFACSFGKFKSSDPFCCMWLPCGKGRQVREITMRLPNNKVFYVCTHTWSFCFKQKNIYFSSQRQSMLVLFLGGPHTEFHILVKETKCFLSSLGEGMVKRKANTASAATTYVSVIHCSAIFVGLLVASSFSLVL